MRGRHSCLLKFSILVLQNIPKRISQACTTRALYKMVHIIFLHSETVETIQMPINQRLDEKNIYMKTCYVIVRTNKLQGDPKICVDLGDVWLSGKKKKKDPTYYSMISFPLSWKQLQRMKINSIKEKQGNYGCEVYDMVTLGRCWERKKFEIRRDISSRLSSRSCHLFWVMAL